MKLNTQIEQLYERLNSELDHFYRDARFYTVKEIMSRFGANRRVVDGALERMTDNGLIERVPNIGIFCKTDRKLREQNVVLAIYDWPSEINRLWGTLIEQKLAASGRYRLRRIFYNSKLPIFQQLKNTRCEALLLVKPAAALCGEDMCELCSWPVPVVFIDAEISELSVSSLSGDHHHGGMLAAEYLLRHGHRRLLVLQSELDGAVTRARVESFRHFAEFSGAAVTELNCHTALGESSNQNAYRVLSGYLEENGCDFSGLFVISDNSVPGVLAALQDREIRVPQEVSIVGYDGLESGSFCRPALTSVANDYSRLAEALLDGLDQLFASHKQGFKSVVPMCMIERDSVAQKQSDLPIIHNNLVKRKGSGPNEKIYIN